MDSRLRHALERILAPFLDEHIAGGGIDLLRSRWQVAGRGAGVGMDVLPGRADVRYLPFLIMGLQWFAEATQQPRYRCIAEEQARFIALGVGAHSPTWALGNALECIGMDHAARPGDANLAPAALRIVEWVRQRAVEVRTVEGVTYRHFPCGYGVLGARDAGWTNDLSMLGSGLVWAYEVTGDPGILADAVSFAEYFVQPWRHGALDARGYWACGTWRDDLGSWVIGPAHFTGFESTDLYGDEASWVFSTLTCTEYLMRLYRHRRDPRYLDRCVRAAGWVFRECQFDDGGVGMCGRDDKWLGFTAHAIRQVAMVRPWLGDDDATMKALLLGAKRASEYLLPRLIAANLDDHGVEWVTRATSIDPLVNVAMLWAGVPAGVRDSQALFGTGAV